MATKRPRPEDMESQERPTKFQTPIDWDHAGDGYMLHDNPLYDREMDANRNEITKLKESIKLITSALEKTRKAQISTLQAFQATKQELETVQRLLVIEREKKESYPGSTAPQTPKQVQLTTHAIPLNSEEREELIQTKEHISALLKQREQDRQKMKEITENIAALNQEKEKWLSSTSLHKINEEKASNDNSDLLASVKIELRRLKEENEKLKQKFITMRDNQERRTPSNTSSNRRPFQILTMPGLPVKKEVPYLAHLVPLTRSVL